MNEIFLQSDAVKVYVILGAIEDIAESTRQQVDYICCLDAEGNQTWHTTTHQDAMEKMISLGHSQQLGKVSTEIQTFLALSSSQQISSNQHTEVAHGVIIPLQQEGGNKPRKGVILSVLEIQELAEIHDRDERGNHNRRADAQAESGYRGVIRQGGVRNAFRAL